MRKIRKGDKVRVLSGRDKGREGIILKVLTRAQRPETGLWVIVEGINLIKEYVRANPQAGQKGGIMTREAPLPACKVALVDPTTGKAAKVGIRVEGTEGKKVRYYKASGEVVNA